MAPACLAALLVSQSVPAPHPYGRWRRGGLLAWMVLVAATGVVAPSQPRSRTTAASVPASPARPALATPVFSLRRLPGVVHRRVAQLRLAAGIEGAVDALPSEQTCVDVRDSTGRRLHSSRPDLALIPASTVKILLARAVLDGLSPTTRLTTEVRGGPVGEGTVADLWLVGGGDPLLSTAEFAVDGGFAGRPRLATSLEALADGVVAAGVRGVGRLLGDDSRHDAQRFLPGWLATYASRLEITPLSALTVNKGLLLESRPVVAAPSPAAHAAATLARLLEARGVAVGEEGEGVAPPGAVALASVQSPPLSDVVAEMLQHSDNLAAETLLKELGRSPETAGSTAGGLAAVRKGLADAGVDLTGLVLADGSGLDRADRVSCRLLTDVLAGPGPDGVVARALPVAGRNGTLVGRLAGTRAAGRLRAKTGSLQGVSGLTGWMDGAGDDLSLVFSVLANGVSSARGSALQDTVAITLAAYPDAPPEEALAPLSPAAPASAPGG